MNESNKKLGYTSLQDLQNTVVSYKDQKLLALLYGGTTFRRPDKFNRLIRLGLIYLKDDLSADFTEKGAAALSTHLSLKSKAKKKKNAAHSQADRGPKGIGTDHTE